MVHGIDEEFALYAFMEWAGEIMDSRNTHLATDGKALSGAAEDRKYAYNILRLAMYETGLANIVTEMMDCFCDNAALREQYVFQGIASLY